MWYENRNKIVEVDEEVLRNARLLKQRNIKRYGRE